MTPELLDFLTKAPITVILLAGIGYLIHRWEKSARKREESYQQFTKDVIKRSNEERDIERKEHKEEKAELLKIITEQGGLLKEISTVLNSVKEEMKEVKQICQNRK